jgi:hypothetical protein
LDHFSSFLKGQVLPRSLATLQEFGIAIDGLSSKGNDAFHCHQRLRQGRRRGIPGKTCSQPESPLILA